jgi:uncharacterized membrane protein YhaH (DUF805 family)
VLLDVDLLGLSAKRLNRSSYFLSLLISMFLFVGIGLGIDFLLRAAFGMTTENNEAGIFLLFFMIAWWAYAIYCVIRRFHDMDMSSWWLISAFIPFLNLYIGLRLLFFSGNPDENKYGQPLNKTFILGLAL